jgi:uncharacterized repeat protein (TIGR01451 family)
MPEPHPDSPAFESFARELLNRGLSVRFEARGASMSPVIRNQEIVIVTPVIVSKLRKGAIVLTKGRSGFLVHRLVVTDHDKNLFITRGDCGQQDDPAIRGDQILGVVLAKEVRVGKRIVQAKLTGIGGKLLQGAARGQSVAGKLLRKVGFRRSSSDSSSSDTSSSSSRKHLAVFMGVLALLALMAAPFSDAQVAVDSASSTGQELTGTGTEALNTFTHTTTATGTNVLMIVGVSLNITNSTTTTVLSVTYGGKALTLLGAHNDAGKTRRVEMWYLLNPPTGTNNTNVLVTIPVRKTVGVTAGAVTFTGVDQTVPLGTFTSADGAGAGYSQLNVPSVVNGMVLDTLAIGGPETVTIPGPQVSEWNLSTTGLFGSADPPDITGSGSARTGAPAVPVSETFSANSNWSEGAVSINPTAADIGVSTTVGSAVFVGQNTTYTTTVYNNGTSAANNVVLTDTWPASMTTVSITPSAGTTCTAAPPPITCTLPTTLASGATATVTVITTASTSGSYANTASVTDSGTPPDLNSGNNTYVAVATVQSAACATVAQATAGTGLTGTLNTYYPGTTASVAAGATTIPVGTPTGAGTAIAAGNLLLIIQMQDASINDSESVAYGNGYTGQGFTALNSAGDYEFVTATGPVSGGSVPIAGAGPGGGLVFAYHAAAASANAGQSTYQVIIVPQYTTASFAATGPTATAWNGSTGGVLVLDTSSTLTLNGTTISVNGLGFRGGAGMQLTGGTALNTDYWQTAPAAYTGAVGGVPGVDANKGEGVAGTPAWVEYNSTFLQTNTSYPSGTSGKDGSMARGAPGNAGGGGTDADPVNNDENAGGGGGGNGGAGGFGGDSWDTNLSDGGEGGTAFPATINRIAMGGGGGAGTRNNSDGDNQASGGSTGGGIIIIRTNQLSGTGTLTANGANAYNNTSNDAGGGGGAGGTIVVLSANGGESGLTLQANGGTGGNAWATETFSLANRHGPGGGGGGGVVLVSGTPASVSVTGGANGLTETPGVPYGATSGTAGFGVTNETITETSGTQSGAQCTPDMTLGKSHIGNFTRGSTASYTIPVENVSPYGSTNATVTVNDTLPTGLTPTGVTGTGWACSIISQTVTCTNSSTLTAGSFYPSLTVNANVLQTAPSTETNTAYVSGGGELNLANDSATDVAAVVSSADLSVTDSASPDPVVVGGSLIFTPILTNNGPSAADNATIVETVPANTTFASIAAPSGWTCTPPNGATGNVVCSTLTMAGSTTASFSMMVRVNTGVASGTILTSTATASSSTSDPNSANNTAIASSVVGTTSQAEMTVTNIACPNPVVAGSDITYTQTATNVGAASATNPTLTETTPANTTFVSISAPPGTTCTTPAVGGTGAISCTAATAPAGSSGTVVLVVQVTAGTAAGTVITDTATANSTNQAFGASSAVATDVVASSSTQADLAVSTSSTPASVYSGNDITYIQTVTNNGPASSTNAVFTEVVPTNTTFASISAPAGWTCTTPAVGATGTVTCTDASLASGASANIIVVVNVASSIAATTITATSTVSSSTADPNSANNSTTTATPVTTICDLAVTDSGTPSPVTAGNNITYTQVVTSSGPSNCSGATFTEAIPANTTFVSLTPVPAGWTCTTTGSISCTDSSFAPGTTSSFPVVVKVTAGTAVGTIITDTVTVGSTTHDSNSANNTATSSIGVTNTTDADLSATNSASPNPVTAGSNVTYTQTVANAGPASASTVTFTETLPANTTAVSLTGPAGWTCTVATLKCTIATLAANATANFTFVVTVNASTASGTTITQTDSVASSVTGDSNSSNNSASASVYVSPSAALSITNANSPIPVQAGNNITYTQVVTNAGPSTATNVTFRESTPPDTTFVQLTPLPSGWSCITPAVGSAGTITCTDASFAPGTASFPVVLKVTPGTAHGTTITDIATVSSSTPDPNSANNSASATDVVALSTDADLVTTNAALPTSVAAGSNITYTQSVTNDGPAVAATPTFTQTTPPNTNFQSIIPPAGWTCTTPAVGAAGTITCTDGSSLAVNGIANFTLALQVNANTPSGTNIAETDTATAANIVPNLTTNSATANAVVANANSANVTITKTASPSPTVASGDTLVYTLGITNTGPASATTVTVTDPLPTDVYYLSIFTTTGTCSQANGTVTCLLGTMANAATATITILTLAGPPGTATNTASVTDDQMTSPNTATQVETITFATSIKLQSFTAQLGKDKSGANRTVLLWKTGGESHNLGFNVYRERDGGRVQLNSSLIGGSALLMNGALPKHSGKTYTWIDSTAGAGSGAYWLEDVEVTGARVLHGPVSATASVNPEASSEANLSTSATLKELTQAQPSATSNEAIHRTENVSPNIPATLFQRQKQFEIAGHPVVKIFVKHEGWYRVAQADLVSAGLDPNVDPSLLHLYAEATEQPIQITGATAGPGGFGSQAAIYFYGTGINTQYSGTRVYFLAAEDAAGQRIQQLPPSSGSNQPPLSFPYTLEYTPHTTYFSALTTANGNNFFGPLISSTTLDETIPVAHFDANSTEPAQLEVILQGVIIALPHEVTVTLNGSTLGDISFTGQDKGQLRMSLPSGLLQEGANTITFTSDNGEYDISLLKSIRLTYARLYVADANDSLVLTGRSGDELTVSGFSQSSIAVLDITNPGQPVELSTRVRQSGSSKTGYELAVQVPWNTANQTSAQLHTLLAVASDSVASPIGLRKNHPSRWHEAQAGSDIAMVTAEAFATSLPPIVQAHQAEGKSSAVISVDDLYDEFNFGEHSPYAVRDFLQTAVKMWHTQPKYLLLHGRASMDPRNYLDFGDLDFVPTKIIATNGLMTASDDWFSDFSNTGLPTIATGRLPVSTLAEAQLIAGKISTYEGQSTNGPWTSQAMMVADVNDTENFTKDSQLVQAQLPSAMQVTDVFATTMGVPQAQQAIVAGINSGQVLVNYTGHGSEDMWSGDDLFDNNSANSLTNGASLPVFLIMDCLNGFFQDVYDEPLGVTLMLVPDGGAVAVLASSGLNVPTPQIILDKLIVKGAMGPAQLTLGDAIIQAKSGITDLAVRKTYNLLGDPAMRIKLPSASAVH